jgi:hypothetical protein
VVSSLDKVSTTNASVVLHVARLASDISSFTTWLTTIESTIAQVATTTDLVYAHLRDMGASFTSWLSLLDSNMTLLAQHPKLSPTSQNPPLVTPNPGSPDGSHDVVDSNEDTNGTTVGPHGDIDDTAGIIPPQTSNLVCNGHWVTTGNTIVGPTWTPPPSPPMINALFSADGPMLTRHHWTLVI